LRRNRCGFGDRTARRDQPTLVAAVHKLTIVVWHVLHGHPPYHVLTDHYACRNHDGTLRRMDKEAITLGFSIRFDLIPTASPA
jgi:hypothetical protein